MNHPPHAGFSDYTSSFLQPSTVVREMSSYAIVGAVGNEDLSLQDLENTAGSWDLYGQTDERRYPGVQAEFFERAAAPLTRRENVYAFITLRKALSKAAY